MNGNPDERGERGIFNALIGLQILILMASGLQIPMNGEIADYLFGRICNPAALSVSIFNAILSDYKSLYS